jgi:hypothetical protein
VLQDAVSASRLQCDKLIQQFSRHLSLLSLDVKQLRAAMNTSQSGLKTGDWNEAIIKYR